MKTTLIALTLVVSSIAIAGSKAPRAERGMRIAENLNLTETQQEQFKIVMQNKHEKIQAAMEVIHQETKAEMATFLNDDQLKTLEESMQKRHDMKKHRKEHKKMRKHHAPKN